MRRLWSALRFVAAAGLVIATSPVPAAHAAHGDRFSGDYICTADCHRSDAPPSIDIVGSAAICRNDLGGVFQGRVIGPSTIACFNMIGTLSANGRRITWSSGATWERRR